MKKVCFILMVLLFTSSCENNLTKDGALNLLKNELNRMALSNLATGRDLSPHSGTNHYDLWGSDFIMGIKECSEILSKVDYNNQAPLTLFNSSLPVNMKQESLQGIDLSKVEYVFEEILRLFIEKDINVAIAISIEMEKAIYTSGCLRLKEKELVLKLTSIIRHTTYYYCLLGYSGSKSDYEDCWRRKLLELQEAGIFTKISCAFSWPVCLGALALDCLVEKID